MVPGVIPSERFISFFKHLIVNRFCSFLLSFVKLDVPPILVVYHRNVEHDSQCFVDLLDIVSHNSHDSICFFYTST